MYMEMSSKTKDSDIKNLGDNLIEETARFPLRILKTV